MKYTLSRTVAPVADVLSLADARAQLRVDVFGSPPSNPEDNLISDLIEMATQELDAGTGWLGRALAPQTWRLGLERFPTTPRGIFGVQSSFAIKLPYPPFISVSSFTYTKSSDGSTVTMLEGTDYRIQKYDDKAMLAPLFGNLWPTDVRCDFDSIQITFRCGYQAGSPPAVAVPKLITNYIKARVTDMFDSRGVDAIIGIRTVSSSVSNAAGESMNSIREWSYEP